MTNTKKAVIIMIASVLIVNLIHDEKSGWYQFFAMIFYVDFIYLILKGIKKIFKKSNASVNESNNSIVINKNMDTHFFRGKHFRIDLSKMKPVYTNMEKHGCKCYMEKLNTGEQKVADILARNLSYKDYFLYNNIIINSKNNISTQIDHIIVSRFGIFVIESKEYSGWIFGSKEQKIWTQSLNKESRFHFQNPIRQNYGHLMALKEMMPFAKNNFINVVVFTGDAEIKTEKIENVVYLNELISYIEKYDKEVLTGNEIQFAIGKLSYACQTINITSEEHVANIYANPNIKKTHDYDRGTFNSYYYDRGLKQDNNPAKIAYVMK